MSAGPVIHADADAFFASVAARQCPELAGLPFAVAAHVVVACPSYPARAYGVHGGMYVEEALARCPGLRLVEVPQAAVEQASEELFDLFESLAAAVEPGSMEEAFLDVSAMSWGEAEQAARELRRRAHDELALAVTVGVGRTKLMAKLGSRGAKPDGLAVIDTEREHHLRRTTPIGDLWGVGGRTSERLRRYGVSHLADLETLSDTELRLLCGTTMARRLRQMAAGTDDATVRAVARRTTFRAEGSVSGYARDDRTPLQLVHSCVERVCTRAQHAGLAAGTLALVLTPVTGTERTRRRRLLDPTNDRAECLAVAEELLEAEPVPQELDRLGVTLGSLVRSDRVQLTLF
ncbi:DNA polymerase Y subunit UmuC family protein [Flindersiella endophytica]